MQGGAYLPSDRRRRYGSATSPSCGTSTYRSSGRSTSRCDLLPFRLDAGDKFRKASKQGARFVGPPTADHVWSVKPKLKPDVPPARRQDGPRFGTPLITGRSSTCTRVAKKILKVHPMVSDIFVGSLKTQFKARRLLERYKAQAGGRIRRAGTTKTWASPVIMSDLPWPGAKSDHLQTLWLQRPTRR